MGEKWGFSWSWKQSSSTLFCCLRYFSVKILTVVNVPLAKYSKTTPSVTFNYSFKLHSCLFLNHFQLPSLRVPNKRNKLADISFFGFFFSSFSIVFNKGDPIYITLSTIQIYGKIVKLEEGCHAKQERLLLAAWGVAAIGAGHGENCLLLLFLDGVKGFVHLYISLHIRLSKWWAHYIKTVCNKQHMSRIWNFMYVLHLHGLLMLNSLKRVQGIFLWAILRIKSYVVNEVTQWLYVIFLSYVKKPYSSWKAWKFWYSVHYINFLSFFPFMILF